LYCMIRLEGVEVAFDNRRVLWVPSAVFRGSSVILGPNGAGKTTLLMAIVGLYRPARGVVEVDGVDVARGVAPGLLSTNIESAYVLPGTRLDDLVRIYCSAFSCDYGEVRRLLSYIRPKARELWKLSAGERKWVTTVLALYADTRVALLDEPLEDLDPWLVGRLVEEIRRASERKQVVLTLHSVFLLREFAGWDLFFMFDGSLYGSVKAQEVFGMEVVRGRDPDAALVFRVRGEEYSLVAGGRGRGVPLREVSDLAQLYSRGELGVRA